MTFSFTKIPWKKLFFIILLLTFVTSSPSLSISRGAMTTMSPEQNQNRRKSDAIGSMDRLGLLLSMLPRGKPVPPSAPSKRHNSVTRSTPHS
ncbi:hypothetical protein Hanom_Chr15g01384141 [Helianthus anomalus]